MELNRQETFERLRLGLARHPLAPPIFLALGFVLTAALGLKLIIYPPSHMPSTWLAGSFLVCAFALLDKRWRLPFAVGGVAVTFLLALSAHWPFAPAILFSLFSVAEAAFAAWLLLRQSRTPRLANMKQAAKLLFLVALPACLVFSLTAAIAAQLLHIRPFGVIFWEWFAGHAAGMATMLPTLLLLNTPQSSEPPRKSMLEKLLLGGSVLFFAVANFSALNEVTFLAILPAATVYAFRLGPKPTVVIILALDTLTDAVGYLIPSTNAWNATMPIGTVILIGQGYLTFVYMNGLFTGLVIDYQARMKALLENKSAAARRARAKALQASRAKTEFLATMSHEIRTPLNGVIGFTQVLLKREGLDKDVCEQVELIGSSGYALLTVVNDILDFSKVEAGRVALDPRPSKLIDVAREAMAIVEPEASRKGLDFELATQGAAEGTYFVDDTRLRQVLINLLNNAVKFTKVGGVRLVLSVTDELVRFEVRDTGAGISADALPRLFQRFTQADSSITRSHGGTGLGLAICKGLVELMGGQIGAESRMNEGSTFWFEITPPVVEAVEQAEEAEVEMAAVEAHVLLVDDHPVNRHLGVTVLGMLGCTAETAENGEAAVQAMRTGRYDLILMDVHMPVMDGIEATRAIRALGGEAAATPIVTMSADVLPEQVARFQAAGMDDRVSKPLDIQELYACLVRWNGRRSPLADGGEDAAAAA